jgi:fatty-acyl-CoA synthase
LFHCFGMVLGTLACSSHGAAVVLPAAAFDPRQTLRAVESARCTSLYGVPAMFIRLLDELDSKRYDVSSLRTGIMSGSPCPPDVMTRVMTDLHMPEVTITYGMTETSPVAAQSSPADPVDLRVATVGRAHPHVEIKVVDPGTGQTRPVGETGEFCTRGYNVMLGYWADPEATASAIDGDGWMHTGDLASIDGSGSVRIHGRIKDMIIRGGENIYPREVEDVIRKYPDVQDAAVVGVPSDIYGEEVCAFITVQPHVELDIDDLTSWLRDAIAHHKVPRHWRMIDELPTTVTGKVAKFRLREMFSADST